MSTAVGFDIQDTFRTRCVDCGVTLSSDVDAVSVLSIKELLSLVAIIDAAAALTNASFTVFFVSVMSLSLNTASGHWPDATNSCWLAASMEATEDTSLLSTLLAGEVDEDEVDEEDEADNEDEDDNADIDDNVEGEGIILFVSA